MDFASLATGLGTGIAGLFGYKGAKEQNIASAQQAQNQMDFQERMSNTAIQRRMADLKKGGLNPILAGKFDASSPAGAMAPQFNKAQAALSNLGTAASIANTIATTNLTDAKRGALKPATQFGSWLEDIMLKLGFDPESERNITNASNIPPPNKKFVQARIGDDSKPFLTNKEIRKYFELTYPEKFQGRR